MLMSLGQFKFELKTTPFQQKQRNTDQRFASNNRVGQRAAHQHLGAGDDKITLSGVLYPGITGGQTSLDQLREMADLGEPKIMVDGNGHVHGWWLIESMSETGTVFFQDGTPRKIDFSLSLKQTDKPDETGL